jgi:hypothetical protein
VKEIYVGEGYPDDLSRSMIEEAGVVVHNLVLDKNELIVEDIKP